MPTVGLITCHLRHAVEQGKSVKRMSAWARWWALRIVLGVGPRWENTSMANMSYCRFENTYHDLYDCYEHIFDQLSENEEHYRDMLVQLCQDILADLDLLEDE